LRKIANLADSLDLTLSRLPIASQDLCEGCFACAISSDQTDFVSRGNPEIYPAHQGSGTNGDLKLFDTEHWENPLLGVLANALVYNREEHQKLFG
jgi:hypothetical protein